VFVGSILACIPLAPAARHTGAQGGKCSYILFQFSGEGLYHINLFCFYLFLFKKNTLNPSGRNDCVAYCGWERRAFAFHLIWSFHSLQLLNLVATGRSIDPEMGRTSLPCQMFFCCPHAIF
ncbi:hypothetical protein Anapl_04586, partial [Anas platyrhynchos]